MQSCRQLADPISVPHQCVRVRPQSKPVPIGIRHRARFGRQRTKDVAHHPGPMITSNQVNRSRHSVRYPVWQSKGKKLHA